MHSLYGIITHFKNCSRKGLLIIIFFLFTSNLIFAETIRVGGDYDYPPYTYIDTSGNAAGLEIEVLDSLSHILNINFEYHLSEWDSAMMYLDSGQVDVLAGVVYSEKRSLRYNFTHPVHSMYYTVFAGKDVKLKDISDLKGKRLVLLKSDFSVDHFIKPMGLYDNFKTANSLPEAIMKINMGLCDYTIAPYALGMETIKKQNFTSVEPKGRIMMPGHYGFALNKRDLELLARLNRGLDVLRSRGSLEKIHDKWIKYTPGDVRSVFITEYLRYVVIAVLIILVLVLFWFYTLKRQVKNKTVELKEAYLKAEEASNAKSQFVSHVSHEIRNPLNSIIGFTHLLLQKNIREEKRNLYLKNLVNSTQTLYSIVNEILDASRIEQGRLNLEKTSFSLKEVLEKLRILFFSSSDEKVEQIFDIRCDINKELRGDPLRLYQVLSNLVLNALKFTSQGEVRLFVQEKDKDNDGQCTYIIKVTDTGIGMTREQQQELFKAFTQADDSVSRKYGGSGLGLFISRQIIDLMDGSIEVYSEKNKGTEFHLALTFECIDKAERDDEDKTLPSKKPDALVLLRNQHQADALSYILNESGYQPHLFDFDDFRHAAFDKTGYIFCVTDYRESDIFSSLEIPVVLLETHSTDQKSLSGNYFTVLKPVLIDELKDKIDEATGLKKIKEIQGSNLPYRSDFLREINILVADDNPFVLEVLADLLMNAGANVTTCQNGYEVLEKLGKEQYDLLLTDVRMPKMDGVELIKKVRDSKAYVNLPVIGLSGTTDHDSIDRYLNLGMNAFLKKPVYPVELYKIIHRFVTPRHPVPRDIHQEEVSPLPDGLLAQIKHIDIIKALERINGNYHTLIRIFNSFQDKHSHAVETMSSFIENKDSESLRAQLHDLIPVMSIIGAKETKDLAEKMQKSLHQNQWEGVEHLFPDFKKSYNRLFEEINRIKSYEN